MLGDKLSQSTQKEDLSEHFRLLSAYIYQFGDSFQANFYKLFWNLVVVYVESAELYRIIDVYFN